MTITRIRCLLLTLVTGREGDGASPSFSETTGPGTPPARAVTGAVAGESDVFFDAGRSRWAAGMASPSFMIVSTLPRR